MNRRSFVRASVLGATTSGLASACGPAATGSQVPTWTDDELANHLTQLDRGMEDLRCRPIDLGRVASRAANAPMVCREDPIDEQLYRSSLRALLLTGSLKDLPEAERARPEVQARLDTHAAEVDFAVHGMTHRLAHMPADELARVQERLRGDPELPRRIIEYIDDEARKSEFPLARRLRLRRLARIALWRLRHQPVQMVVHECTDKVQRLSERLTPLAVAAPFARPRAEEVAYWEARTLRVVERYQDTPAAAPVPEPAEPEPAAADLAVAEAIAAEYPTNEAPPRAPAESAKVAEDRAERRRRLMRTGGIVLGVGVALLALGLGLALGGAAAAAGLGAAGWAIGGGVLATAAGITLIVGLVVLVVGDTMAV